jgi:hypothetical protein
MKLIRQPNRWSCLPTAFAIALDVSYDSIIKAIGHDGSKKIWPGLPEPRCRRSFHIREMIDVCYDLRYAVIEVDKQPISVVETDEAWANLGFMLESAIGFGSATVDQLKLMKKAYDTCNESTFQLLELNVKFEEYLKNNIGVLIGKAKNNLHAVAWDGNVIIDPSGKPSNEFDILQFYMLRKMQ